MLAYERKRQILDVLQKNGGVMTVEQLCQAVYASGATVRRDLTELAESKLIRRTRGGAMLVEGSTSEDPLIFRENQNSMKKRIIADMACRHIRDGMTLFLDPSTTVSMLAHCLGRFSNLKVITNGAKTVLLLSEYKNLTVMSTGGTLRENSKSLIGLSARSYIEQFNADLAFVSCRGFSIENGASEANEDEYYIKQQYMKNARKTVLLCDTSKMGTDYLCRLAPLSAFWEVITERKEVNDLCARYTAVSKPDETRP